MDLNQLKIGVLSTQILEGVNDFAADKSDGLTVRFKPNDPELAEKISKYRQYSLAFEMVDELENALTSNGLCVNPFVHELMLNLITMVNDQKNWHNETSCLEFVFTKYVTKVQKTVDVLITFRYDNVNLFSCSHNLAIKAIR